ncbi:MAG: LCP family protein [Cyanobacteria bacterium P01_H01_bin.121]
MTQCESPRSLAQQEPVQPAKRSGQQYPPTVKPAWLTQTAQKRFPFLRGIVWGAAWSATALASLSVGVLAAFLVPSVISSLSIAPTRDARPVADNQATTGGQADSQAAAADSRITKRLQAGLVPYRLARPVNLLIMGTDRVAEADPGSLASFEGRSDTLLLVRANPDETQANVLSIPRDTQIEIPEYGLTKINHANWFGGPSLARQVIEHNFQGLAVDRYLRVSTDALRALVDLVGGVEVYVPEDMYYTDQTQGLYIDLKEGRQTLNGDQAEQFARFRYSLHGDISRVQRQQILLKALRAKLTSPQIIGKVPELVEAFQTYIDTNLTFEELLALTGFALQLDSQQVQMVLLPGRPSTAAEFQASYWLPDEANLAQILATYFEQPVDDPLYLAELDEPAFGAEIDSDRVDGQLVKEPRHQPLIAVQNASDQPDVAQAIARHLRNQGYWNVYVIDGWPDTYETTEIIVQRGDVQAAEELQTFLDLGVLELSSTGDLESDLTLRLGQDAEIILNRMLTQHEAPDVF